MSGFGWDAKSLRYRDLATGRWVPVSAIRQAMEVVLDRTGQMMGDLAERLGKKEITLGEYQGEMTALIKHSHIAATALAKGGLDGLRARDLQGIGEQVRTQEDYLMKLARGVAGGEVDPTSAAFKARSSMYAVSARQTYFETEREMRQGIGMTQERRVLSPAEHCPGCEEQAGMGWQPIGTLAPIGSQDCLTNCKCTFQYK